MGSGSRKLIFHIFALSDNNERQPIYAVKLAFTYAAAAVWEYSRERE